MEEIEVPVEQAQEEIHHHAQHSRERWVGRVALSSALLAALAAVAALLAGHHSNEAMIAQIKASDQWSYYQAKGLKSSLLSTKTAMLESLGRGAGEGSKDAEKLEQYKKDQEQISEKAKELEHESEHHLHTHEILARAVTLFQVAIALAAISVLTKRRRFFLVSLGFGLIGVGSLVHALLVS